MPFLPPVLPPFFDFLSLLFFPLPPFPPLPFPFPLKGGRGIQAITVVGVAEGTTLVEGDSDGKAVGPGLGKAVGPGLGGLVTVMLGPTDGASDSVGTDDGSRLADGFGETEGAVVGTNVGWPVGAEGDPDGGTDGT